MRECTWVGCTNPGFHVLKDVNGKPWAYLCPEHFNQHDSELDSAIENPDRENIGKMLSSWIKSQGGAHKAAKRCMGGGVMNYSKERGEEVPCCQEDCLLFDTLAEQNCDGECNGEPAIASCSGYAPDINHVLKSLQAAYAELREAAEEYRNAEEVYNIMAYDSLNCSYHLAMRVKELSLFAALDKLEG